MSTARLVTVLHEIQDAHAYLLGNPTDGASKAMECLRQASRVLLEEIKAAERLTDHHPGA